MTVSRLWTAHAGHLSARTIRARGASGAELRHIPRTAADTARRDNRRRADRGALSGFATLESHMPRIPGLWRAGFVFVGGIEAVSVAGARRTAAGDGCVWIAGVWRRLRMADWRARLKEPDGRTQRQGDTGQCPIDPPPPPPPPPDRHSDG